MSNEPKVVKRMAPTFIKPLSPPKPEPQKTPEKSASKKVSRKSHSAKKPVFGEGKKTEGQNREYQQLMRSKVLGPLLLKDELRPVKKDPIAKTLKKDKPKKDKSVKDKKKPHKKCEKKDKIFCSKIYFGQGGRRYIKHANEKIYLDKRKSGKNETVKK